MLEAVKKCHVEIHIRNILSSVVFLKTSAPSSEVTVVSWVDRGSGHSMAGFMSLCICVCLVWLVAAMYFQSAYELTKEE